jgi:hypothetical protein
MNAALTLLAIVSTAFAAAEEEQEIIYTKPDKRAALPGAAC